MANSAPKVAEAERFETDRAISLKAKDIANLIKHSKHFIVFTGAGVSTSAGNCRPVYFVFRDTF